MWRNTALRPRFFFMDANALGPFFVWALHMSWWTFYVAVVGCGFFFLMMRYDITPVTFFRILRCKLVGPYRPVTDRTNFRRRSQW